MEFRFQQKHQQLGSRFGPPFESLETTSHTDVVNLRSGYRLTLAAIQVYC